MPLQFEKPSNKLANELREVSLKSDILKNYISSINNLSDEFPKNALLLLCSALKDLPHGTSEGCISTLITSHVRIAAIRTQFVHHAEANQPPNISSHNGYGEAIPPLLRGEDLDRHLSDLYSSIGSAIEQYKLESGDEITEPLEPVFRKSENFSKFDKNIGSLRQSEAQLRRAHAQISTADVNNADIENIVRVVKDANIQTVSGRAESEMPDPRHSLILRLSDALRKTGTALVFIGSNIKRISI